MTWLVVPIMVSSVDSALMAAQRAAQAGADGVEFRIDLFEAPPHRLADLVAGSPLPCIVTCRPIWEGGQYDADEQTRISLLEHAGLGDPPPGWIDVEWAAYQRSANLRQKVGLVVRHPSQARAVDTQLILSSHDFDRQPADLDQRVNAMAEAAARVDGVVKIAWRGRSLVDNLRAFEILMRRRTPTIALCMGESGLPSRVLAKKFGALLTFASLDHGHGTAAGQPTIEQVRHRYRWESIGQHTRVYGVVGHPVGHSLSPAIHNAGFDAVHFDGVYLPMPVQPGYAAFQEAIGGWLGMEALHFSGASVTIPHKENLIRFVREQEGSIEPLALQIGAANTLVRHDDGSLYACNTDYAALLDALCGGWGIGREGLGGRRVAVVGSGGAARAAVAGLAHYGATVVVYNRTLKKAQRLVDDIAPDQPGRVVAARLEKLCDSCCHAFINCTPVGMHPQVDATPIPIESMGRAWGPDTVVMDTIYNPIQTRLLREAQHAGCVTISGVEMFVRQAAAQFQLWTAHEAPSVLFHGIVTAELA